MLSREELERLLAGVHVELPDDNEPPMPEFSGDMSIPNMLKEVLNAMPEGAMKEIIKEYIKTADVLEMALRWHNDTNIKPGQDNAMAAWAKSGMSLLMSPIIVELTDMMKRQGVSLTPQVKQDVQKFIHGISETMQFVFILGYYGGINNLPMRKDQEGL